MRYALDIVRRMRRAISAMYITCCPTAKLTRYCCLVVPRWLFATKGIFVTFSCSAASPLLLALRLERTVWCDTHPNVGHILHVVLSNCSTDHRVLRRSEPPPLLPTKVEDSSADECPPEEHPSFSRKITTEYLRLGERFLGTPEEFSFPEDNAADSNNSTATVAGNALLPSPSTRSSAIDTGASKRVGVIRGREHVADVRDSGSDLEAGVWLGRSQKSRKSGGYQGVSGVSNGDEEEAGLEMREAWPATTMEDQTGSFVGGRGDGRVLAMSPSARRAKSPPPPSLPPEPRPRRRVGSPAAREAEARLSSRNKRSDGYSAGGRWVEYAGSPRGGQPAQSGGARKNVGSDDVESDGNDEGSPTALLSGVPRSDEASHDLSPEAVVDHGDQNEEGGKEESKGLVVKAAPSVQRRDRSASPSSR